MKNVLRFFINFHQLPCPDQFHGLVQNIHVYKAVDFVVYIIAPNEPTIDGQARFHAFLFWLLHVVCLGCMHE